MLFYRNNTEKTALEVHRNRILDCTVIPKHCVTSRERRLFFPATTMPRNHPTPNTPDIPGSIRLAIKFNNLQKCPQPHLQNQHPSNENSPMPLQQPTHLRHHPPSPTSPRETHPGPISNCNCTPPSPSKPTHISFQKNPLTHTTQQNPPTRHLLLHTIATSRPAHRTRPPNLRTHPIPRPNRDDDIHRHPESRISRASHTHEYKCERD